MSPTSLFTLQFLWFLIAWSAIATLVVGPAIRHLELNDRLSVWVAPHLFRALGIGLLVPNLSPGLPMSFALPTAVGDMVTAMLALASLIALRTRQRHARALVWVFNVFGSADLALAIVQAARVQATTYLEAQWYVPALGVPLMLVAHYQVFREILGPTRPFRD